MNTSTHDKEFMMSQSPSSQWIADPEKYRQKLFGLLGDRHPLEVAASTADVLTEMVENFRSLRNMNIMVWEGNVSQ